jgi:hypothetical protein
MTFNADPFSIYLCDGGRALCGEHLGHTAKTTGRDLSGQQIMRVDPAELNRTRIEDGKDFLSVHCDHPKCGRYISAPYTYGSTDSADKKRADARYLRRSRSGRG